METLDQRLARKLEKKRRLIRVAAGQEEADLVIRNARFLNVFTSRWEQGDIAVAGGIIAGICGKYRAAQDIDAAGRYLIPGLIDAHIHLESAIVMPAEFARIALRHGTTTVICDPHEIANVMGTDGIRFMLQATEEIGVDVMFMLPSCVPATPLDEAGASLSYRDIDMFYSHPRVLGLAEMMNYTGVLHGDREVLEKILAAQSHHKKIDGHAPALSGADLDAYIAAGVYSDHECSDLQNAMDKLRRGQFIMIREGTAAHNLDALLPLIQPELYSRCMFATDDKHPNDLLRGGHIDAILRRCFSAGTDPILALKTATHNAARYFLMNNKGAIAGGYVADLVLLDDLPSFRIARVIKRGKTVFESGKDIRMDPPHIDSDLQKAARNSVHLSPLRTDSLAAGRAPVIRLIPGQIVTEDGGYAERPDPEHDILLCAVFERHRHTGHIGIGYLQGYGLRKGAVATSISHDSHNIIAVGVSASDILHAVHAVAENGGGIFVTDGQNTKGLPLPIAGLMSDAPMEQVNACLEAVKDFAFSLGVSRGIDPFMTLSFLALPVIPKLKLTTHGVFDVEKWAFRT